MAAPPDLVLLIGTQVSPPALNLTLIRDAGASWRSFAPVPLTIDPASHVAGLYRHLTGLTVRADPAGTVHDPANNRVLSPYEIDRRVRDLGRNLWEDLIPQDFKDLYARERHQWRDRSLLVLSDDPHLPWELVWPYGEDWQDDEPWCCTLRLTRWLRRAGHGNGNDGPPSRLSLRALAVLAPHDADLPSVRQERNLLLSLAATHRLRDVSPGAATWPEVMQLLEQGDYDWLHIATHGKFHPTSPDGDTVVWLEDKATLSPATVVGPEIEGPIRRRRPAFLFNACDVGQQGWGLTGLAGWAARLLNVGAGLFAGPLWEITDDGALRFVDCFYREVLGGATVAEAVQKARLRARRAGDPTWLAYSFYAHPNARVFSAPEVP
jgi:CHAT domain